MRMQRPWYWVIVLGVLGVLGVALTLLVISVVSALLGARQTQNQLADLPARDLVAKSIEQQQNGDLTGAEKSLEEALVKEKKLDYQSQLAVIKYRLRKYEESIKEYRALIDVNKDLAFAWNGTGNAYRDWALSEDFQRTERQQKALEAYRAAIAADAGYVAAYTNQALLLKDMNLPTEALQVAEDGYERTNRNELKNLVEQLQK